MPSPMTSGFSDSVLGTATAWHTLGIEETLFMLKSDRHADLTNQQAIERLQRYDLNELQKEGGRSSLSIFID